MGELSPQQRFAQSPVARLATVAGDGTPHLVPVVFALRNALDDATGDATGDATEDAIANATAYTAVDAKPKTTRRLRRLANIEGDPRVSILVDHYADDWTQLWWVRADGLATIHRDGPELRRGYELLRTKYPQYESVALNGPVIAVAIQHWAYWHA